MASTDFVSPLVAEIGIGGIGGFIVGYALKKIAKILVVLLGLGFLILQYLAYQGIININYSALTDWAKGLVGQASGFQGVLVALIAHIPFGATFAVGFALGLKMG